MKKSLFMAAAVLVLAACQKNKESEAAIESASNDTITTITDQVEAAPATTEENSEAAQSANAEPAEEIKAVKSETAVKVDYASFGDKILADKAISKEEMIKKYKSLKPGDTVNVKFKSKINAVCQKKGCWMSMALPGGKESFVKFKDYAFFVPLNATDQEAIVSGKAFVSETSVAQLRHYAKDGGESDEAIAKITEPKIEYKFMADGVLISK
ncbi:DUF4920 domain-containing protein [Flavobacterium suzhouense]|uniref:DUF4920 domain-containing protein n=1 Tax=Flavobacterium suzhouense TaxID=1529638 RepID=A0ABW5NS60_9FLAO